MKRELKLASKPFRIKPNLDCRAYPDEKGIETQNGLSIPASPLADCRAYPDEKGIETDR